MATEPKTTTIQIERDVKAALIARMKAQETYNDVLRRLLGLENGRKPAA